MNDDEKGKQFLGLIDEQSNLQRSIVVKLSSLIRSKWNSNELQNELETLVEEYSKITKKINSLDENTSFL
ncbi:MAG: hypothetical protein IIA82_04780 [Thaumarchaeota archaeon]|nr:hypothetical protein [Nitrososphaerota archaeon]